MVLDLITPRDHVRLLRATISSHLSLDRHVSTITSSGFYWQRQLRRVRRSLDMDSATAPVHSSVSSRVDYCNTLPAGAPKTVTNKLQPVLNYAARVSDTDVVYTIRPVTTADCPPYAAVNHRRSSFPGRRCSCLERFAAPRHVGTISGCLLQSPQDTPLQALLSIMPFRCCACEVTLVIV